MISSLFGKTRPVNYILVLSVVFIFFSLAQLHQGEAFTLSSHFLWILAGLCSLLLSLFLVNFIVQRNQLTAADSYAMLFYAQFCILFQEFLTDPIVLMAAFFLLLAQRRLISMKSLKNLKEKIFDAALYIFVASLFVNWTLLFILIVWIYIYFYTPKKINYWLIPIAAAVTVALTSWSVFFLSGDPQYLFNHFAFSLEPIKIAEVPTFSAVKTAGFLILISMAGIVAFIKQGKSGQGRLTQLRLLVIAWIAGIAIAFLTGERFISAVGFAFLASAVFAARYVESIRKDFIKDIVMYGFTAVSILVFFLEWVVK
ncbi:hypothetical protein [Robiginitalea sp.]|uniref:hypothetical protein n=1 Tax=Robiginitalea sp. TaxID=1902411 RepID=UPI003C782D11